jgi:tRNA uridine 5-carbamoylmethylation protein Kti12
MTGTSERADHILLFRLNNLIFRYEEPSSMVRWDSPLFTVLWEDNLPPVAPIWEALTKGVIKPPNSGTLAVGELRPVLFLCGLNHYTI